MSEQDLNLYTHYQKRFAAQANKELLCTEKNESFCYTDFARASAHFANLFSNSGVKPGDRISVQVEKSPASLGIYLACLRGGFVYHPLNPAFKAADLDKLRSVMKNKIIVDGRNIFNPDVLNQEGFEYYSVGRK